MACHAPLPHHAWPVPGARQQQPLLMTTPLAMCAWATRTSSSLAGAACATAAQPCADKLPFRLRCDPHRHSHLAQSSSQCSGSRAPLAAAQLKRGPHPQHAARSVADAALVASAGASGNLRPNRVVNARGGLEATGSIATSKATRFLAVCGTASSVEEGAAALQAYLEQHQHQQQQQRAPQLPGAATAAAVRSTSTAAGAATPYLECRQQQLQQRLSLLLPGATATALAAASQDPGALPEVIRCLPSDQLYKVAAAAAAGGAPLPVAWSGASTCTPSPAVSSALQHYVLQSVLPAEEYAAWQQSTQACDKQQGAEQHAGVNRSWVTPARDLKLATGGAALSSAAVQFGSYNHGKEQELLHDSVLQMQGRRPWFTYGKPKAALSPLVVHCTQLTPLTNLQTLVLKELTVDEPGALTALTRLTDLQLRRCKLRGSTARVLLPLAGKITCLGVSPALLIEPAGAEQTLVLKQLTAADRAAPVGAHR